MRIISKKEPDTKMNTEMYMQAIVYQLIGQSSLQNGSLNWSE